ncbi:Octapeptide-repeat protein T2, partial [Ophiophagus hannah]
MFGDPSTAWSSGVRLSWAVFTQLTSAPPRGRAGHPGANGGGPRRVGEHGSGRPPHGALGEKQGAEAGKIRETRSLREVVAEGKLGLWFPCDSELREWGEEGRKQREGRGKEGGKREAVREGRGKEGGRVFGGREEGGKERGRKEGRREGGREEGGQEGGKVEGGERWEERKEGRKEEGREGEKEGRREGWKREGGKEGKLEGGREEAERKEEKKGKEGSRERGREGRMREGGREGRRGRGGKEEAEREGGVREERKEGGREGGRKEKGGGKRRKEGPSSMGQGGKSCEGVKWCTRGTVKVCVQEGDGERLKETPSSDSQPSPLASPMTFWASVGTPSLDPTFGEEKDPFPPSYLCPGGSGPVAWAWEMAAGISPAPRALCCGSGASRRWGTWLLSLIWTKNDSCHVSSFASGREEVQSVLLSHPEPLDRGGVGRDVRFRAGAWRTPTPRIPQPALLDFNSMPAISPLWGVGGEAEQLNGEFWELKSTGLKVAKFGRPCMLFRIGQATWKPPVGGGTDRWPCGVPRGHLEAKACAEVDKKEKKPYVCCHSNFQTTTWVMENLD